MKLHSGALTAVLVCILAGCSQGSSGISGTYLAHNKSGTDMLQLTEAPGGAITGALVETAVKPNGTIQGETINASGQVAGSSITLTLREAGLGFFSVNASGTVSGNPITGRSITLVSNG